MNSPKKLAKKKAKPKLKEKKEFDGLAKSKEILEERNKEKKKAKAAKSESVEAVATQDDVEEGQLKSSRPKDVTEENAGILERPKVGDTVKKKYSVLKELGEGGFGVVLEVECQKSHEHYAMKVELEQPPEDEPGLELEGAVLRRLQGYGHILRFIDEGKHGEFSFLVMQLAGHNLNDLRKHCPEQRFTNSSAVRLALQCLEAIETVHVAGFLHRDIKPANFAMGFHDKDSKSVYVLDFGLVRRFRTKEGKIRPQRKSAGFRGSYQYASINAHRNADLGRCDDVWSWLYSVIQMRVGKLPWRKMNGKKKIGDFKEQVKKEELLNEMEPEFYKIYDNLTTLKYESEPPYGNYRDSLMKIVKRRNYSEKSPFDWEEGGEHYQLMHDMKPHPYVQQSKKAQSTLVK